LIKIANGVGAAVREVVEVMLVALLGGSGDGSSVWLPLLLALLTLLLLLILLILLLLLVLLEVLLLVDVAVVIVGLVLVLEVEFAKMNSTSFFRSPL
jgi:hypothetical protein